MEAQNKFLAHLEITFNELQYCVVSLTKNTNYMKK